MKSPNLTRYNLAEKSFLFFLIGLIISSITILAIVLQTNNFISFESGKIIVTISFLILLPIVILSTFYGIQSNKKEGSTSLKNLLSLFGNSIFFIIFILMILVNVIHALS